MGRAGSARFYHQPTPRWLRSTSSVARMIRDPLNRQHGDPAMSKGEERPVVGTGSWPVESHEPAYPMCVHWALARGRCASPSNPRRRADRRGSRDSGSHRSRSTSAARSRRNAAPRALPAVCGRRNSPAGQGGRRCLCAAMAWPETSLPAAVARSFRWPTRPPSCRCYPCSAQSCRRPATPVPDASD